MRRRIMALCCALMMLAAYALAEEATAPPQAPEASATARPLEGVVDGDLRVLLQSLGNPVALGLTLDGAYSVGSDRGFQFEPGTEISLGVDGGSIMLKAGGATIDMGSGFSLRRHLNEDGTVGGVYIHESQYNTPYPGDLAISVENGGLRVILTLNMEEYLYGVVPYEMNERFPLEALKAQAVAARTYAMQRKMRGSSEEYDVVDTTNDQVYKGYDERYEVPIRAVDETRGVVGLYKGNYAECFYSASNGGQTALATDVWGSGDFGYLDIRDDPYDLENPESQTKWALVTKDASKNKQALYDLILNDVAAQLNASGELQEGEAVGLVTIENVEAVNPIYGGESRQYGTVRFTVTANARKFVEDTQTGTRTLGEVEALDEPLTVDLSFYDAVRDALGIKLNSSRSDMLSVEAAEDGFTLTSRRLGHGVGMSQRGAQQMAGQHGKTFLDILHFYYPGMELVQITWTDQPLVKANELPDSLGYAAPRPTPAPTPAPLPPLSEGEYYATVVVEGVDATLNVRSTPSMEGDLVVKIRNGARMIVEEETEDGWLKMRTAEVEGYVMKSFTQREE